ncbi:MAG TPA: sugar ABC transporter permease [Chloroflexota bacterium]|nr:sugar ABC transporter permease [Chloroflexota bacterium]
MAAPERLSVEPGALRARRSQKHLAARFAEEAWGYFFIAPSLLAFVVFSAYPMLDSILLSFHHLTLQSNEWVGLQNYVDLSTNSDFYLVLANTARYLIFIVPVGVVLSLGLSVLVFRLSTGAQVFFKSAYYLPHVTAGVVLSFIWLYLYDPGFGLLDYLLHALGFPPVLWLSDQSTSLISIVVMYHAISWGGAIILITASLGGIPEHLYEAARIDGASQLRQTLDVTLPLLKPAIAYVAITGTIAALQIFTEIYVMTGGGPNYATANLVFFIYDRGFTMFDFGTASAVAVILLVVTVAIALVQFRVFASDVEY